MVVKERADFMGRLVPLEDWKVSLQEEYPFMQQDPNDDNNTYRKYGFQCAGGWYHLLKECCKGIIARYEKDGLGLDDIDFVPVQIKEKFGTLRFYYGYTDAPCGIAAFDNLATGVSMRFEPTETDTDSATAKRRQDIRSIVRSAEQKSKNICEKCGADGKLRNDSEVGIPWVQTLCDACHERRLRQAIEARMAREQEVKEILRNVKTDREE